MSKEQNLFVKTLWYIAGSIAATMLVGIFLFYTVMIKFETTTKLTIEANESAQKVSIKNVKEMHNKDVQYILKDIKEIKLFQKEIMEGQVEVIKLLSKKK